jgi:uncharacterized repeat protein (TIGR01451 family)
MSCYSPIRIYLDDKLLFMDSVRLPGNEQKSFSYLADGRTWRLEVDQHPYYRGPSRPAKSVERCGNPENWTADLVNTRSPGDADPVVDVFCGPVRGSYDPNDKSCIPKGVGSDFSILPDAQLEYLIRFQNTGNDTAFSVIIRDTLDMHLNPFSVRTGVASHDYSFRIFDQGILEWTFHHILLPDSTTDEPGSHGFATFIADLAPGLADGTTVQNRAAIYFDYNDPIITNSVLHTVNRNLSDQSWSESREVSLSGCRSVDYGALSYDKSGKYWHIADGGDHTDTLITIIVDLEFDNADLIIEQDGNTLTSGAPNAQYQWFDCVSQDLLAGATSQNYIPSSDGEYAVILSRNACVDTSHCFQFVLVDVDDQNYTVPIRVFPNPAKRVVNIDFGRSFERVTISLWNTLGCEISSSEFANISEIHYRLDDFTGVGLLRIEFDGQMFITKIVSQ